MFMAYEKYDLSKLRYKAYRFILDIDVYVKAIFPVLVANRILVKRLNKENE